MTNNLPNYAIEAVAFRAFISVDLDHPTFSDELYSRNVSHETREAVRAWLKTRIARADAYAQMRANEVAANRIG